MERGESLAHAYNLGLGQGISVREMFNEFEKVVGFVIGARERPRHNRDPSAIWTSNGLAAR
jgi:UDP-glucose 4-epimerase